MFPEEISQVAKEAEAFRGKLLPLVCDVTDSEQAENILDFCGETFTCYHRQELYIIFALIHRITL